MLAVDTNFVVRYLTGDHPSQAARARAIIDCEDVLVTATVMLETEWVLRTIYGYKSEQLADAIEGFAGLPHVTCEKPENLLLALAWLRAGMDFADAFHLAAARECDAFLTFDEDLIRSAKTIGLSAVRRP